MKTSEAAHVLNVSATTLRAWETRYSFPTPTRTLGRHRIYARGEILALRRALDEGLSISSAIEKVRSNLGIDDSQLDSALRSFDARAADDAMEAALAVRRLDTAVSAVLLSAVETIRARAGTDSAAWAFAARWSVDWLRRQTRLGPTRSEARLILIGDATAGGLDPDLPYVAALEMFCARAGMEVLTLPVDAIGGISDAVDQVGVVLVAGADAGEEQLRRWLSAVRAAAGPVPLVFFRGASRSRGAVSPDPLEAQQAILPLLERPPVRTGRTLPASASMLRQAAV